MDHLYASMLLFISLSQWIMADLAGSLLARLTLSASINLIFLSTILSGSTALLVKYLIAVRILPMCKLVSGSLLVLLVSWYIDHVCKNNTYLLVRSVGVAIIVCAVLAFVVVSEEGFAGRQPQLQAEVVAASDYQVAGD
jgi:predicted ABC-type exoprotein transport system permease subunit